MREGDVGAQIAEARQARYALGMFLQLAEEGVAENGIHAARVIRGSVAIFEITGRLEHHQFFRLLHRQRGQNNLVQQREDRGVGANSQAERDNDHQAEQRRVRQGAKGVADPRHAYH
jgi:hypothetical protein